MLDTFAGPGPALYVDPGSGSLLLQVLVGGTLGGVVAARMKWQALKSRFRSLVGRS